MTSKTAWDIPLEEAKVGYGSTKLLVALLFACLVIPGVNPPRSPIPLSEIGGLLIAVYVVFRAAPRGAPTPTLLRNGLALILLLLVFSSVMNHVSGVRRVGHVFDYAMIAYGLASGRVHARSAARGLVLGLMVATPLSLLHVHDAGYTGRLTGLYADPNAAGFYQVVLGACALAYLSHSTLKRYGLLAVVLGGIVKTLSRTSMLATAFGAFWIVLGRRLGRTGAAITIFLIVYSINHIPQQIKGLSSFSDRTGSDELRVRILAQEHLAIAGEPWYGNGAGTSKVTVGQETFFFHNSYLAARNEGGWLLVILLVGLIAVAFLSLFDDDVRHRPQTPWLQAALIGVLVCSVNLGEVLLELPTAVAIGLALAQRVDARLEQPVAANSSGLGASARGRVP